MATWKAAEEAGADFVVLCDTNGGTLPSEVAKITAAACKELLCPVGIHTHNDIGLAVANAIAAVEQGASTRHRIQHLTNQYHPTHTQSTRTNHKTKPPTTTNKISFSRSTCLASTSSTRSAFGATPDPSSGPAVGVRQGRVRVLPHHPQHHHHHHHHHHHIGFYTT